MYRTVELEGASSCEGTDVAGTIAVDLHIFHFWCTRLFRSLRLPIVPRAVGDNVRRKCSGNQRNALPFVNCDGRLHKLCIIHLHLIA